MNKTTAGLTTLPCFTENLPFPINREQRFDNKMNKTTAGLTTLPCFTKKPQRSLLIKSRLLRSPTHYADRFL